MARSACLIRPPSLTRSARLLRREKSGLIPRGQCSRAVLDMLRRADGPMAAREIADQLAVDYRMDASNARAMNALVAKVRNTLAAAEGARERAAGRQEGVASAAS